MKKIFPGILIIVFWVLCAGCATPLIRAISSNDVQQVKTLLDEGADPNESAIMSSYHCWLPIECAVNENNIKVIEMLLDKGARIDDVSPVYRNMTVLIIAAASGNIQTTRFLIEKGANVNLSDDNIGTALGHAAYDGHFDVMKLLIENGADTDLAIAGLQRFGAEAADKYPDLTQKANIAVQLIEKTAEKMGVKKSKEQAKITMPEQTLVSPTAAVKSDIDVLPLATVKPNKNSFAIVIGIENYHQKLPKADFATSDAKLVTEYLTKALGYPEENVITLLNENATNVALAKYFEKWLVNNAEKDSTVFIYYSGHGAPNTKTGDAFLVPYDGDPSFINETGYSLKRMYTALDKLPAKKIIVALDSCFSGAGGRSVIAKGSRPLVMNLQANTNLPKNMTVLTASSGDQTSSTYDEKGHGLFTYFLLKGIKNEDVVMPDGSIKMDDLFSYIKPQVERIARKQYNNEQSPQLIAPKKN